jgi:hypothetical protein
MNIDAMSDETIDRLIDRYRDYLDSIDAADPREFETMKDYRRYLAGKIARLEGERERRRAVTAAIDLAAARRRR